MTSLSIVLDRRELSTRQGERLTALLASIYGRNPFYTRKLDAAGVRVDALRLPADFAELPLTTKAELIADQAAHPPWGTALTEPIERYTRYCQTSSTTGRPLRWIDTNESWQWMLDCWKAVYAPPASSPATACSFRSRSGRFSASGPASRPAVSWGCIASRAAGCPASSAWRSSRRVGVTVRLLHAHLRAASGGSAAAHEPGVRCRRAPVRLIIVAGEPGGSIPATRERIEQRWGARVIDHHGATEVGPLSFECLEAPGVSASERGRVHLRSAGSRDGRGGARRRARRAGRDEPGAHGESGHPLSHRRHRRPSAGAVRVRADLGAARGRHPRAGRRHGRTSAASTSIRRASSRSCDDFPDVANSGRQCRGAGSMRALLARGRGGAGTRPMPPPRSAGRTRAARGARIDSARASGRDAGTCHASR